MYNTVLGAKPLQADGRTFYYADYNFKDVRFTPHIAAMLLRHVATGSGRLSNQHLLPATRSLY